MGVSAPKEPVLDFYDPSEYVRQRLCAYALNEKDEENRPGLQNYERMLRFVTVVLNLDRVYLSLIVLKENKLLDLRILDFFCGTIGGNDSVYLARLLEGAAEGLKLANEANKSENLAIERDLNLFNGAAMDRSWLDMKEINPLDETSRDLFRCRTYKVVDASGAAHVWKAS